MKPTKSTRFMSDWAYGERVSNVDREKGIIYGFAVVTPGEAKGHGVQLDMEFCETVIEQGNALKGGATMRYGHPTMSGNALGSFMGKAKNFRWEDGSVRADAFLSNVAKDSPSGNLYDYILNLAEEQPDAFGASIVFKPGKQYKRDEDGDKDYDFERNNEDPFIECDVFSKVDFVDDPAANPDGLFATTFSSDTIAGQVSEFLDTHPQVWELLCEKPEIVDGFMEKYAEYRSRLTNFVNSEGDSVELSNETASVDAEPQEDYLMEKELIQKINDEFGADILAQTMLNDGDYEYAKMLHDEAQNAEVVEQLAACQEALEALKEERDELKEKLDALSTGEEDAVEFEEAPVVEEDPKPVDIKAEINARKVEGMSAVDAQDAVAKEYPEAFEAYIKGE